MVCFGAVVVEADLSRTFYGKLKPISENYIPDALAVSGFTRDECMTFNEPKLVMEQFRDWLLSNCENRILFVSDNNGFDWQFMNWYFHHFIGANPFGHSSTNLGSLYKGMQKDTFVNFKHLLLLSAFLLCSCSSSPEPSPTLIRWQQQEDAVNSAIRENYAGLQDVLDGKELGADMKLNGLHFMIGRPTSDFEDIFSSAYTCTRKDFENPEDHLISEWIGEQTERETVYALSTNIWKLIGMLEDATSADTLVILVDNNGVITDYRFFANLAY